MERACSTGLNLCRHAAPLWDTEAEQSWSVYTGPNVSLLSVIPEVLIVTLIVIPKAFLLLYHTVTIVSDTCDG